MFTPDRNPSNPGYDELLAEVKRKAKVYLDSFPGLDYRVMNRELHSKLRDIIRGTATFKFIELELLRRQIESRLDNMKTATEYKNSWGLPMKNCEDVEAELGAGRGSYRWYQVLKLVETYHLFDNTHDQDYPYDKGVWYITSCIHSQGWDDIQAVEKIGRLINYRVSLHRHVLELTPT